MVHPLNAGHTAFNKDTPWEGVGKIPETAKWKGRDVMLCETQRPYRATMARHLLSRGSAWAREGAQGWWESTDLPAETTGCHDPLPRARHLQGKRLRTTLTSDLGSHRGLEWQQPHSFAHCWHPLCFMSVGSWKPSRVSDPHLTALLKPNPTLVHRYRQGAAPAAQGQKGEHHRHP